MAELLQQLITGQAERCPDTIALVMNDEWMSHGALEELDLQRFQQSLSQAAQV